MSKATRPFASIEAKKILSISPKNGEVTFDIGDGTGTQGTKSDCDFYGYNHENGRCYIQGGKTKKENSQTVAGGNNTSKGRNGRINGSGNQVITSNVDVQGTNHFVDAERATVTGHGGSAIRYGEEVYALTPHQKTVAVGNRARAQRSVLIYQGQTTDATETEIFLGGVDGERFIVDEDKECVISFESRIVAKRVDSSHNGAMGKFQHATFRVTGGVLDRLGIQNKTNHHDGISSWSNDFVAVSDTPDYIKATVTGQSSATIDWTIILYINEIRTSQR